MIKSATATSFVVLLLALSPTAAQAKSIKDLVSDAQLAEYCSTAGVDTETTATITLTDGTTATGTIHCEAEDLIVGSDDLDDPDDDDLEDGESGDDDGSDDDSGDNDDSKDGDDSEDD